MEGKVFVVLSHYSNENICEFGVANVFNRAYSTFEAAKDAVDREVTEDRENHGQEPIASGTESEEKFAEQAACILGDADYLYVAGDISEDGADCYHSIYAVIELEVK